jgi:DNA-binding MarR family transcriptional regulator
LRAYEDALFARFDLTPQQYNVLRLLKAEHPEPVATLTIAERLVSRAPDITRMLDKLEARKLISRQRSETDRRTVHIRITLNGIALLDQISEPLRECHNQQLGHLNKSQLKQLVELLKLARQPHEDSNNTWR